MIHDKHTALSQILGRPFEKSWNDLFAVWEKLRPLTEAFRGDQPSLLAIHTLARGFYRCDKEMVHESLYKLLIWLEAERNKMFNDDNKGTDH